MNNSITDKKVLSVDELYSVLPLGRNTIYKLLQSGEIPSIRIGKRYIIPIAPLEKWLNKIN